MTYDRLIPVLNNLIEMCRDSKQGLRAAAENIESPPLKTLLNNHAQQRGQFADELQSLVHGLEGDPEPTGGIARALHRGWARIKSALTARDDMAIMAECERGEHAAMQSYAGVLNQPLPSHVRLTIERQYIQIQAMCDLMRTLVKVSREEASGLA
jgi:uncharacterized protein (TIGR02284 family)